MFILKAMKKKYLKIRLVDKCLILIMSILMVQSVYTLFSNAGSSQEINVIDVAIRTSMAAIFGYFISANFTREYPPGQTAIKALPLVIPPAQDRGIYLYETPSPQPSDMSMQGQPNLPAGEEHNLKEQPIPQLQVLIVTTIGACALFMLIIYRNFFDYSTSALGSLSQLRDFVSGCVGFLIGCGREDVL